MSLATTWPAPPRPTEGVLAIARPLPAGWERGVRFTPTGCLAPSAPIEGCDTTPDKTAERAPAYVSFDPFTSVLPIECSTLSGDGLTEQADAALAAVREYQVGRVLWSGGGGAFTLSPNLAGVDTPVAGTYPTVVGGVAALEQAWAAQTFGRVGVLHLAPAFAVVAVATQAIWRNGTRWQTAGGHAVSISSGYVDGVTAGATGVAGPIYLSHAVHHGTTETSRLVDVDRAVNTVTVRAEETNLVAFDPCLVLSVAVDTEEA